MQTAPIPLFINFPSLPVRFSKLLPSMTPSNIRSEVFKRFESAQINEVRYEEDTNRQDDSSLQTKLNRLKKLNKSLTKENLKLRDTQKYCSGCKVELLFNSDREMDTKTNTTQSMDKQSDQFNSPGSSDESLDTQSQKTEVEADTNLNLTPEKACKVEPAL